MVGRYWLPSSYYRKESQLMGVFMEIKRPKIFVFSWHSAKSLVNVWLGSEVRSHDLGNTGAGDGGGAETGSCDISAIKSWQPTFNVLSKYPYGYWCGVCENFLIHIFWLVPGGSSLRAPGLSPSRPSAAEECTAATNGLVSPWSWEPPPAAEQSEILNLRSSILSLGFVIERITAFRKSLWSMSKLRTYSDHGQTAANFYRLKLEE